VRELSHFDIFEIGVVELAATAAQNFADRDKWD
jgi:hypothetical protein